MPSSNAAIPPTTGEPLRPPPTPLPPSLKDKIIIFLKTVLYRTVVPIGIMFLVFVFDQTLPFNDVKRLGIIARDFNHLSGIFFAPFIHANLSHLIGNILSLWTLLFMLTLFYPRLYWKVFFASIFLSGLFTWIIGNEGIHIGSSGVVYALASFIFFSGFIQKRISPIFASIIIFFAYRYLITGLFPRSNQLSISVDISYSSHWSGVLSGVILTLFFWYLQMKKNEAKNKTSSPEHLSAQ